MFGKIAVPYAEALLELANANSSLKETTTDINNVSFVLANFSDLKKFLGNPLVTRDAKKSILKYIFDEEIGEKTLIFLMLLVDRGRIAYLDSIAYKFVELSNKEESIEIAKVTSFVQLSSQQQMTIVEKLKKITGAKQIKLALKLDPQLIGGFTIEMGSSKLIDASIRGHLKQISTLLGAI
jgi:F-type H+-transporting ATPase subunit delta